MIQKHIRPFDGRKYSLSEGEELIKELDDRTKYADAEYNSIERLGENVKEHQRQLQGVVSGYQGPVFIVDVKIADGIYSPQDTGTYPNAGGLIFAPLTSDKGKAVSFIKTGETWVKSTIDVNIESSSTSFENNTVSKMPYTFAEYTGTPYGASSIESGYYIPELAGKDVTGLTMKTGGSSRTITYGIADVDVITNIVSNFVVKGTISVANSAGVQTYRFPTAVPLGANQLIYIKGGGYYNLPGYDTQIYKSFLKGQSSDALTTHFDFSYALVYSDTVPNALLEVVKKYDVKDSFNGKPTDVPSLSLAKKAYENYQTTAEKFLPYKLSNWVISGSPISAGSEFGYYIPELAGETIEGITALVSVNTGTLYYGIADVNEDTGVVSNYIAKGSFSKLDTNSGLRDFVFPSPIILGPQQAIYIKARNLVWRMNGYVGQPALCFYKGYNSDMLQTEFNLSFTLIYSGNLRAGIKNLQEKISQINKRVNYSALGDSITFGAYGGDDPALSGNSYAVYLSELLNANSFQNLGIGGKSVWLHMRDQVNSINADADLITFNFGANDVNLIMASTIDKGEYKDVIAMENLHPVDYASSVLYNDSFFGRFRWCVEYLKAKFPNAIIFCLTTPDSSKDSSFKATEQDVRDGQIAICNFLGVPSVDLLREASCFNMPEWQNYLHDQIHPEKRGYKMMAGAYYQRIKAFI